MSDYRFDEEIIFSEDAKEKVRKPLGKLFEGKPPETTERLAEYIRERKPTMLIIVGDFSAKELSRIGIHADIYVVDGRVERKLSEKFTDESAFQVFTKNPAGTISTDAANALKEAIRSGKRAVVYVEGEEDLLTLPAIVLAPLGSMVVYGQPSVGVVAVEVTEDKKREICAMLRSIKRE
ncbi:MAG: GTP-dependent dephospho-CoA kinase family protein [Thaumarchaeota archaeon]|jgi:uncharacterized protein (UPF0218 family)|nr:GTP-dependent dephospho-CoA kinase family protein [Candidatus Terraquivivens yellowstonensis]